VLCGRMRGKQRGRGKWGIVSSVRLQPSAIFALGTKYSMKVTSNNTGFQELVKEFAVGDDFDED
jgi:hypothetical protein